MGETWVAVRATLDEVATSLGWKRTRRPSGCSVTDLETGWSLVFGLSSEQARELSRGRESVRFSEDETSELEAYVDGEKRWSARVDEPGAVRFDGDADAIVSEAAEHVAARQRDSDNDPGFVAVAAIAEYMCGYYTYDEADDHIWEGLQPPGEADSLDDDVAPPPEPRFLTVDDGVETAGVTLHAVLDAVASFMENPREGAAVSLALVVDGTRRTLRATIESGELLVVALGDDGRRVGRRMDDTAIAADELVWLFSAFYPEGKRLARYAWRLRPS